jgi:hypothetical protein
MYGLTRGTFTLLGVAEAGLLLWLASTVDSDALGGYWAYVGLIAVAGLLMAVSQLLGGWTKWGWPRISASVFVLGFLPGLVAGGIVLLDAQPDSSAWGTGLAGDLGVGGLAEDLTALVPAIAFGIGLLFGFTFDTTGRRAREVEVVEEGRELRRDGDVRAVAADRDPADEPVAAERAAATGTVSVPDRDVDGVDDRTEAPVVARTAARDDGDTPGTADESEPEPRRRRLFSRH